MIIDKKMSDKTRKILKRKSTGDKCSYFDSLLEIESQNVAFNVQVDHYKLDNGTIDQKNLSVIETWIVCKIFMTLRYLIQSYKDAEVVRERCCISESILSIPIIMFILNVTDDDSVVANFFTSFKVTLVCNIRMFVPYVTLRLGQWLY